MTQGNTSKYKWFN